MLVQVERTGKDQRDAGLVHSEDVKNYLIERLNVHETAIAIKSSEKDDIEGIDLLAEGCPIEWIITKAALAGRLGLPVCLPPRVPEQHGQPAEHDPTRRPSSKAAGRDQDSL